MDWLITLILTVAVYATIVTASAEIGRTKRHRRDFEAEIKRLELELLREKKEAA